jgi:hypothetical protein
MSSTAVAISAHRAVSDATIIKAGFWSAVAGFITWSAMRMESILRPIQDNRRVTFWPLPFVCTIVAFTCSCTFLVASWRLGEHLDQPTITDRRPGDFLLCSVDVLSRFDFPVVRKLASADRTSTIRIGGVLLASVSVSVAQLIWSALRIGSPIANRQCAHRRLSELSSC